MEQLKKCNFQILQKYSRILVRKHTGVSWQYHEGWVFTLTWVQFGRMMLSNWMLDEIHLTKGLLEDLKSL